MSWKRMRFAPFGMHLSQYMFLPFSFDLPTLTIKIDCAIKEATITEQKKERYLYGS